MIDRSDMGVENDLSMLRETRSLRTNYIPELETNLENYAPFSINLRPHCI